MKTEVDRHQEKEKEMHAQIVLLESQLQDAIRNAEEVSCKAALLI